MVQLYNFRSQFGALARQLRVERGRSLRERNDVPNTLCHGGAFASRKEAKDVTIRACCHVTSLPEAGRQYHFTCTGRDVFGNINRDHELRLTSFFNYVAVTCPEW